MKLVTLMLIILLLGVSASALKCYSCPNCKIAKNTTVTECASKEVCGMTGKSAGSGEKVRACAPIDGGLSDGCKEVKGTQTCLCSSDKCNGSGIVQGSVTIAVLVAAVTFYWSQ